jgi:hypothetical protein
MSVAARNTLTERPGTTHVAWGIALAETKALAVGASALECPMLDASEDLWLAWGCSQIVSVPPAGYAQSAIGLQFDRLVIDSKAMRRIEDNSVYLAIEVCTTDAGPNVGYSFDLRYLLQPSSR